MSDSKKDKKDMTLSSHDGGQLNQAFSSFFRNEHHNFVLQKSEKLASALYMVTGFIPSNDPLKTRVRTCAIELVTSSANPEKARDLRYHEGFASICLEIGSILNLAERAGFISPMNARILHAEYADLASFVSQHTEKVFDSNKVDVTTENRAPLDQGSVGSAKANKRRNGSELSTQSVGKRTSNHKRHLNRREIILSLLNKKDKITVKDVCAEIEGCSEKTIQRELMALVDQGILMKEGERRWSTYRKVV